MTTPLAPVPLLWGSEDNTVLRLGPRADRSIPETVKETDIFVQDQTAFG